MKENTVVMHLKEKVFDVEWVYDKQIESVCSKRRPELLDMDSHIVIVEIEENKHNGHNCLYEHRRMIEISPDLNHHSLVMVQFNPDGTVCAKKCKVTLPWRRNKQELLAVMKTSQAEYEILDDWL